uniref:C-type lectin domain containing 16A n=1 Tax=Astyanax mexicanus TaxID=7994 RepID=A0A8B9JH14_ASTMX
MFSAFKNRYNILEHISYTSTYYYLLSNNHVNSIIVHKFDFSDEEIMAYYISFLKTLSLKLNNHTVHFFYNEHTNDFALYTEAIKFFNHPESMVRIAVRTITLNVYKVDNQHMLHYIRDKTAVPYFSNLVWFIGSHVIELDKCVQTDEEHKNRGKLSDLVAEHLDHLHYLNDILIINCEFLNDVLTDHLLNRLFLPLYVYSLVTQEQGEDRKINPQVSLYLLSQVHTVLHVIHETHIWTGLTERRALASNSGVRRFTKPPESLERSLEMSRQRGRKRTQKRPNYKNVGEEEEEERGAEEGTEEEKEKAKEIEMVVMEKCKLSDVSSLTEQNITDEEKTAAAAARTEGQRSRPFLDMVYNALDCELEDYHALFVLCLLFAMSHSKGINPELLEKIQLPVPGQERSSYSQVLVERLIRIMNQAAQPDGRVRLATLELCCLLLKQSVLSNTQCIIKDVHLACLEGEEIFLDMFEDEYRSMTSKPLNVEYLMMDASILLPPTGTPLTGIDFVKRLPCGDVEKTRRAIRVFFMLRALSLQLQEEPETQLPLTRPEDLIKTDDVLDLNNSDLIACMVVSKDGIQAQRFLAVDVYQMSLVEPDTKRLGWGVVKFAGLLQDMQVSGVEDDSRALNITIHKPTSNPHAKPLPILQASFIFADHIRCIIAKQRLAKGRIQARRMKMQRIAALLDLPVQPSSEVLGFGQPAASSSQLPFRFYDQARRGPAFASVDKVPGFAVAHIAQHSPSPLSSPSPSSSGSTSHCDSVTASSVSVQSATQTPALAPSLTPAAQPTISLLSDADAETLSVDSLTLLPPADPPRLRSFSTQSSAQEEAPDATQHEHAEPVSDPPPDDDGNGENTQEEDRKDISVIPEEDEPSPDSEPAETRPPNTDSSREEAQTQAESEPAVNPHLSDLEDNPDLEQDTEID